MVRSRGVVRKRSAPRQGVSDVGGDTSGRDPDSLIGRPGILGLEPTDGFYIGFRTKDGIDTLIFGPSLERSIMEGLYRSGVVAALYPEIRRDQWLLYKDIAPQMVDWAQGDENKRFRHGLMDRYRVPLDTVEWWRPSDVPDTIRWVGLAGELALAYGSFPLDRRFQPGPRTLAYAVAAVDPVAILTVKETRPATFVRGEQAYGKAVFKSASPATLDPGMTVRVDVEGKEPVTTAIASVARADTQNGGVNRDPLSTIVRFVDRSAVITVQSYAGLPLLNYAIGREFTPAETLWLQEAPVLNSAPALDPFRRPLATEPLSAVRNPSPPGSRSTRESRTVQPLIPADEQTLPRSPEVPYQPSLLDEFDTTESENLRAPAPRAQLRTTSKAKAPADLPPQEGFDFL